MPDRIDTLIDHAAELQRDVDRLNEELLILALVGISLGVAVMILGWRLWHES